MGSLSGRRRGKEGSTTGTCVRTPARGVPFVHRPVNTELTVRQPKSGGGKKGGWERWKQSDNLMKILNFGSVMKLIVAALLFFLCLYCKNGDRFLS